MADTAAAPGDARGHDVPEETGGPVDSGDVRGHAASGETRGAEAPEDAPAGGRGRGPGRLAAGPCCRQREIAIEALQRQFAEQSRVLTQLQLDARQQEIDNLRALLRQREEEQEAQKQAREVRMQSMWNRNLLEQPTINILTAGSDTSPNGTPRQNTSFLSVDYRKSSSSSSNGSDKRITYASMSADMLHKQVAKLLAVGAQSSKEASKEASTPEAETGCTENQAKQCESKELFLDLAMEAVRLSDLERRVAATPMLQGPFFKADAWDHYSSYGHGVDSWRWGPSSIMSCICPLCWPIRFYRTLCRSAPLPMWSLGCRCRSATCCAGMCTALVFVPPLAFVALCAAMWMRWACLNNEGVHRWPNHVDVLLCGAAFCSVILISACCWSHALVSVARKYKMNLPGAPLCGTCLCLCSRNVSIGQHVDKAQGWLRPDTEAAAAMEMHRMDVPFVEEDCGPTVFV